jgi:hypothetical protein
MKVLMVRSKVKAESVAEAEAGVKKMFAAIAQAQPKGVHYASCKLADGVTFVALLQLDEGVENPLPALPEFMEFQASLEDWRADGPPVPEQLTVVGSYGLFD